MLATLNAQHSHIPFLDILSNELANLRDVNKAQVEALKKYPSEDEWKKESIE